MADIDLERNKQFKEGLLHLGFKKKGEWFVRDYDGVEQHLGFPYATHGERKTRYYSCSCGFSYPEASSIAEKLSILLFDTGGNAGYVIPQRSFFLQKPKYQYLEWRLSISDSEKYVSELVCKILYQIGTYVVPYLDFFRTKEAFINVLENQPQRIVFLYDKQLPPILYFILGKNEKAMNYMKQTLEVYKKQEATRKSGIKITETREYMDICITGGSNYNNYLRFFDVFSAFMSKGEIS